MDGKGILLTGIITDIFPSEVFGNFEKRVVWLKQPDSEKYPEHWAVEFQQGDCNLLDRFKRGEVVTVKIDIRGKKWEKNGKSSVFNTLKAWAIEKVANSGTVAGSAAQTTTSRTGGASSTTRNSPRGYTNNLDEPLDDYPG